MNKTQKLQRRENLKERLNTYKELPGKDIDAPTKITIDQKRKRRERMEQAFTNYYNK